jgi:hypothetical protein
MAKWGQFGQFGLNEEKAAAIDSEGEKRRRKAMAIDGD